MNQFKNAVILFLFCLPVQLAIAQKALQINAIFEEYGKEQGSILVELSTDVLEQNTRMVTYKSLIIPAENKVVFNTKKAILKDLEGGSKMIESQKDGEIETGYYSLKHEEDSKFYEYILYKNKSKKLTLVYIRGQFSPRSLESELDKLKDLFIYVNKKRIKLQ